MVLPHGLCQLLFQINFTRMFVANKIGMFSPPGQRENLLAVLFWTVKFPKLRVPLWHKSILCSLPSPRREGKQCQHEVMLIALPWSLNSSTNSSTKCQANLLVCKQAKNLKTLTVLTTSYRASLAEHTTTYGFITGIKYEYDEVSESSCQSGGLREGRRTCWTLP